MSSRTQVNSFLKHYLNTSKTIFNTWKRFYCI